MPLPRPFAAPRSPAPMALPRLAAMSIDIRADARGDIHTDTHTDNRLDPERPAAGDTAVSGPPGLAWNRFERAYFAWAEPRYARMPPEVAEQARAMDRFLYSRRGLWVWAGVLFSVAGMTLGLVGAGIDGTTAALVAVALVILLVGSLVGAWIMPDCFSGKRLLRIGAVLMLGTYAGSLTSILASSKLRAAEPGQWTSTLLEMVWRATPFQFGAGLLILLLTWVMAKARRQIAQRELADLRLRSERDCAARDAAEAQLRLLQAQIQPHFIFNTLASLQHWVDTADPRAGPLLCSLTRFLRGSTELMGRAQATLGEEAQLIEDFLAIAQARLGPRLSYRLDIAPDCEPRLLPPGLLLTLVENALEHGISPRLAGGRIDVSARLHQGQLRVTVRDDGVGLAPQAADGVGLGNCRARLQHRFGEAAQLSLRARADGPGTEAELRIDDAERSLSAA